MVSEAQKNLIFLILIIIVFIILIIIVVDIMFHKYIARSLAFMIADILTPDFLEWLGLKPLHWVAGTINF